MLRLAGVVVLVLVVLAAIGIGGAEYYTSQPAFCGSCHIMDPYYDSWSRDIHGAKLGVRCVDCHYAPGEKFTIAAKFKGLSQATSYFSGRAGASRPRAHVSDASCMTAACHADEAYMKKMILLGERRIEKRFIGDREVEITRTPTVQFSHEAHIQVGQRVSETEEALGEISQQLESALRPDQFARVRKIAESIGPPLERRLSLRQVLHDAERDDLIGSASELMRLKHARTRLSQLSGLTCASCHTFDASGARHLAVDLQACYTCHFTNESFNNETAACLKCHEPPRRQIVVHDQPTTAEGEAPALMNHQDIVARGIDCGSCHFDVIRGETTVTRRDCTSCHDQDSYLVDFDARDTQIVTEYHRVHVAGQRARCADCHNPIEHKLVKPAEFAASGDFLLPVKNDCQHCHPDHHHRQLQLLMGTGGSGIARDMPNAMFGSRLNCRACHTEPGTDFKGAPLLGATEQTCIVCHSDDYKALFQQWVDEIARYVQEAESALVRVDARVAELKAVGQAPAERIAALVEQARSNLQLVKAGNGIHNKNYALQLLDIAIRNLDQAMVSMTQ
jgi:nitrate/TMAO reductase-like tetraheme cytochrome c subunit